MKKVWTMSTEKAASTARLKKNQRAFVPCDVASPMVSGAKRTNATSNGVATAVSKSATSATMSQQCM